MSKSETAEQQASPAVEPKTGPRQQDVTRVGMHDYAVLGNPSGTRRQSMQGFDADYIDIVDYIIRSTHKIWEEKGIGRIYDHYRHNAIVHQPFGPGYSREEVVQNSIQVLEMFPDRRNFGEDVIWTGNDKDGFYTSHRLLSMARHAGGSLFGPATGKRTTFRILADCKVFENRVCEEWLVRDSLAIARHLGADPWAVARRLRGEALRRFGAAPYEGELQRGLGQQAPAIQDVSDTGAATPQEFVELLTEQVWNRRMFHLVPKLVAPNVVAHHPGPREVHGVDAYRQQIIRLLSNFPDGKIYADNLVVRDHGNGDADLALRWTFLGSHDGAGEYGDPTHAPVRILGISHMWLRGGKLAEEWTVYDPLAIMAQVIPDAEAERTLTATGARRDG